MAPRNPADLYRALIGMEVPQPANIAGLPTPNEPNNYYVTPRGYETLIGGTTYTDGQGRSTGYRPASRIAAKDRLNRSSNWASTDRPGPARQADRAAAQADALLQKVLGGRGGVVRDADISDLEAAANALLGEEPIGARTIDESVSANELTGAFTSEDPTEYSARKQVSADINPYYTVEVPARIAREGGRSGTWTTETPQGFRPAVARIDPSQVIDSEVMNRRKGRDGTFTGESDNTASFQRERPITIGDLVKEAMNEERTPVITASALQAAREAGRARSLPRDQRDRNLVGYMTPPGSEEEVPVYAVTDREGDRKTTEVVRPDPRNPLSSLISTQEEYFRVGDPYNRDSRAIREQIAPVLGVSNGGQYGPAPALANQWDRAYAEKTFQSPKFEDFLRELAGGSFMQDPDEASSSYKLLADALITGEIKVAGERPGTVQAIPVDREAILGLTSADGRPLFSPGSNARALLGQAVAELRGGREVDLFSEAAVGELGDNITDVGRGEGSIMALLRDLQGNSAPQSVENAANELFGYESAPDSTSGEMLQGHYGDFGDNPGGVSVRSAKTGPGDTLDRAAIALTGDIGQGLYLADVARRSAAPGRASGTNAYGTTVGPVVETPARDPLGVLLELTGRRSPVESTPGAQQLRRLYQNDFESISGAGRYVLGQRGYNMMVKGLGAPVGSPAQEKAMALLAERIGARRVSQQLDAQAAAEASSAAPVTAVTATVDQSMLNAPAPVNTDPEALERQAALQRLQRRREGFTGPRAGRIMQNFGNVG
jgi:hypothetical protein